MGNEDKEKERVIKMDPQVENQVRRRVADALASAGVSPGIVSREVLFMLPAEFVQLYVELFDQALIENVSASGMGREGDKANPVRRVLRTGALRDKGKGGRRVLVQETDGHRGEKTTRWVVKDSRRAVVQVGAGGGKRKYKDYWVVKDEQAFEVKRALDRRLRRLAGQVRREMQSRSARDRSESREVWCSRCNADLTSLMEYLGGPAHLRHCPICGDGVRIVDYEKGIEEA